MLNESIITIENYEKLKTKLNEQYDVNPDSEEKGKLNFPVNIKLKDGEIITVNRRLEIGFSINYLYIL